MSVKTEVLRMLEENRGTPLSGEEMAGELKVSRAAVWKAVKALEGEGHRIAAVPGSGYRLDAESDVLTEAGIRSALPPVLRDCPMEVHPVIGSTNTHLKALAGAGAPHGTLVVAGCQTAGRGRLGRSFYSPADSGLYLSLLLRPDRKAEDLLVITIASAVAVCRAIEHQTGVTASIKWVNDIFVGGRKVCGILTEAVSDFESGMVESIVIGVGVNIRPPEGGFPPEVAGVAGALGASGGTRNQIAAALYEELLALAGQLTEPADFLEEYRSRSLVLGRALEFVHGGERITGIGRAISDEGSLVVDTPNGELVLKSGEVSLGSENFVRRD